MIDFHTTQKVKDFRSYAQMYKYLAAIAITVTFTTYALTLNDGHIAYRIFGFVFLFSLWNVHKINEEVNHAEKHINILESEDMDDTTKENSKFMLESFGKKTIFNVWLP